MGSGALLSAIQRGFNQFKELNLIGDKKIRVSGAQPSGCAPIVNAIKSNSKDVLPIEYPETIAKSLAVGDPGSGFEAIKTIRQSGGTGEFATDAEIVDAIKLLAKTEGIFTEPAGGVTVAVLNKLAESGEISPDEKVVFYITGNGLKATEALLPSIPKPVEIEPNFKSFEKAFNLEG